MKLSLYNKFLYKSALSVCDQMRLITNRKLSYDFTVLIFVFINLNHEF